MIKRLLMRIENRMIGRKGLQRWYEMLHRISVRGMNFMKGHTVAESGELWAMAHVQSCLAPKSDRPVVFDVGANQGLYADYLEQAFGAEMELHCFEPGKTTFAGLKERLAGRSHVTAHPIGLGAINGALDLHYNHEGSTIATLYPVEDLRGETQVPNQETIQLRRLDDFCAEQGIEQIGFLKIDVEGAELDVLKGAERMLSEGRIRFVQFEFGPNNMASATYMKDFFRVLAGFRIYRILQNGLREMPVYSELYEIPLVSNYLAERR